MAAAAAPGGALGTSTSIAATPVFAAVAAASVADDAAVADEEVDVEDDPLSVFCL